MRARDRDRRLPSLDGLRGIASAAVVCEHALLIFPTFWSAFGIRPFHYHGLAAYVIAMTFTPLKLLWAGDAAVAIFFVLSGLVLSLPFWRGRPQDYRTYAIRRIFRLYPVYLFSLVLGSLMFAAVGPHAVPGASKWFARAWTEQVSVAGAVRALFFFPGDALQLNASLWTLIHEMRISLVLPAIFWLMARAEKTVLAAAVVISFAGKIAIAKHLAAQPDLANAIETVAQVWYFVTGASIARHMPRLQDRLKGLEGFRLFAIVAAGLGLCIAQWLVPLPPILSYSLTGVGAMAMVILAACSPPVRNALVAPLSNFLGRISYSLYAVHFPLVFAAILAFHGWFGLAVSDVLGLGVGLAVAVGLNRWIEWPAMRVGRHLTQRPTPGAM